MNRKFRHYRKLHNYISLICDNDPTCDKAIDTLQIEENILDLVKATLKIDSNAAKILIFSTIESIFSKKRPSTGSFKVKGLKGAFNYTKLENKVSVFSSCKIITITNSDFIDLTLNSILA